MGLLLCWEKLLLALRWGIVDRREDRSYFVCWVFFVPHSCCFLTLYFNENHLYCLKIELYLALLTLTQRLISNCIVQGELRGTLCSGGTIPSMKFPLIKPQCSSETHGLLFLVCLMHQEELWLVMSTLLLPRDGLSHPQWKESAASVFPVSRPSVFFDPCMGYSCGK